MNRKITKSLLMERAGLLNEDADLYDDVIHKATAAIAKKHNLSDEEVQSKVFRGTNTALHSELENLAYREIIKKLGADNVDFSDFGQWFKDTAGFSYDADSMNEGKLNENKNKPHKSNKMNRKITKRLLMERAGLLTEAAPAGKMIGSIGQQSPMSQEQAAQMIKNAPEGHLAVSIFDEDLGDVNHNISKKDALQTLDWYHNSETYSSRIDAGEQLAFPITYGAESDLYVTDQPHNYPNYDGPGSSSYVTEEVDEGEMVADEASTSNEIKEFMEAHCSVDELDQIYEYLQEMMKRVAEQSKEDGKRYAKLAKKMARK